MCEFCKDLEVKKKKIILFKSFDSGYLNLRS